LHRKYAESIRAEWRILSAWYGFLHPEFEIENYEARFRQSDLHGENWWRLKTLFRQARALPRVHKVVLLGGSLYRGIMKRAIEGIYLPREITEPFAGLPIGQAMSALRKEIIILEDVHGREQPLAN
jgi:hypothetical protein